MISIQNVTKNYGRKVAVDNLSLEIAAGEFFAVLGPNGAGKTTTIKMLAGLLRPTAGKLVVAGVNVQDDPIAAKRLCAYVPDQPFLYDKLSGIEFMNFIADLYEVDGAGRLKEIERLIDLFGMKEFVRELTESYSHGMKQRLVLAATLLHKPKVILVDEPLVGLDPHTARLVKQVFRYMSGRQDTPADRTVLTEALEQFRKSDYRFKELMVALVKSRESSDSRRTVNVASHH